MSNTLIDGEVLLDDLHKRMLDEAEHISAAELGADIQIVLALRGEIHQSIARLEGGLEKWISKRWEFDQLVVRFLWEIADKDVSKLPPQLQEILALEKVVRAQIMANQDRAKSEKTSKPKRYRTKPLTGELNVADQRFESVKSKLAEILSQAAIQAARTGVKNSEEWKLVMKFLPFVELAKATEMTAEDWMDCDAARRTCAKWLEFTYAYTPTQASTFYAHVTAGFRDRPNSMWQEFKKMKPLPVF